MTLHSERESRLENQAKYHEREARKNVNICRVKAEIANNRTTKFNHWAMINHHL